jgi:EmrB/QacA subfamily drug resistance transporter
LTQPSDRAVIFGLMVPTMAVVLNLTMFGVALPAVRDGFQIQTDVAALVVVAYTLPFMLATPLDGRLGDELGKRHLFLVGIFTFLVGTLVAVGASTLWVLVVGRFIQGLGAASAAPLSMSTITRVFPPGERGKALGTWNSIGPIAGMAGPLLAGLLVDYLGWRFIYGPILLVALGAIFVVREKLPAERGGTQLDVLRNFDWGGVALLTLAVTSLMVYLSSQTVTGVAPLQDWRLFLLTGLFFAGFVLRERRHRAPFIALRIFADKDFTRASLSSSVRMFAMSGIGFLVPLYLTDVYDLSAAATGIVLMVHSGALLVTMRAGGQFADRWNGRWPVTAGLALQFTMMLAFAFMPETTPIWLIVAGVILHGLGAGLSLAALHRVSLGRIPQDQAGMAAGLYSMVRFGGILLGPAVGGVLLQQGLNHNLLLIESYQLVFGVIAAVTLLGVVMGFGLRE